MQQLQGKDVGVKIKQKNPSRRTGGVSEKRSSKYQLNVSSMTFRISLFRVSDGVTTTCFS